MPATNTKSMRQKRPAISISEQDYEMLSGLAAGAAARSPDVAQFLSEEVERARIIAPRRSATQYARVGSRISYRDDDAGKVHDVTLVLPGDADIAAGRISVLTPVGAALVGMAKGQSISYPTRGGLRELTVISVDNSI